MLLNLAKLSGLKIWLLKVAILLIVYEYNFKKLKPVNLHSKGGLSKYILVKNLIPYFGLILSSISKKQRDFYLYYGQNQNPRL